MHIELPLGHAYEAAHRLHELAVMHLKQAPKAAFGQESRLLIVKRQAANGAGNAPVVGLADKRQDSREHGDPIRIPRQPRDEAQRSGSCITSIGVAARRKRASDAR